MDLNKDRVESDDTIRTLRRSREYTWTFDEYFSIINTLNEKKVDHYVRHDVDFSIKKALELAELESRFGMRSTYYILLNSQYYNPFDPEEIKKVQEILNYNHKIGAHIDLSSFDVDPTIQAHTLAHLVSGYQEMIDDEITYVTFHKPLMGKSPSNDLVQILGSNFNMFCPEFNRDWHYISDSGHLWREDPFTVGDMYKKVLLNTHPVHWNFEPSESGLHGFTQRIQELKLDLETESKVYKELNDIVQYYEKRGEGTSLEET